jgi:hypothetical protein
VFIICYLGLTEVSFHCIFKADMYSKFHLNPGRLRPVSPGLKLRPWQRAATEGGAAATAARQPADALSVTATVSHDGHGSETAQSLAEVTVI